uniref:Uncharacterized protein n=1 Tax=Rhizophora mucronata TaxID=61149 RepID=A0A2P2LLN3_RHIMU
MFLKFSISIAIPLLFFQMVLSHGNHRLLLSLVVTRSTQMMLLGNK